MKMRVLFNFLSVAFLTMNVGLYAALDESQIKNKQNLDVEKLEKNPLVFLTSLIDEDSKIKSENHFKGENVTFVLSTANKKGAVSSRVMYLANIDDKSIYFVTSNTATSSKDMSENPNAAATFFFTETQKGISLMGKVDLLSEKEKEQYFKALDKDTQIMHFIADPIRNQATDRNEYEKSFVAQKEKAQNTPLTMPKEFMVYKLIPNANSFVQESLKGNNRVYYFKDEADKWTLTEMTP